jgi:hypothetical protein
MTRGRRVRPTAPATTTGDDSQRTISQGRGPKLAWCHGTPAVITSTHLFLYAGITYPANLSPCDFEIRVLLCPTGILAVVPAPKILRDLSIRHPPMLNYSHAVP